MLTEEGSGKDVVEKLQKHNLHLPSTDQVYTLPSPTAQSTPKTPTAKVKASPSLLVQNLKKLVASACTVHHKHWQPLILHGTSDGSDAGSDLEHLNLSNSTSSTSSNSLQRLEKLVLGGLSLPHFLV